MTWQLCAGYARLCAACAVFPSHIISCMPLLVWMPCIGTYSHLPIGRNDLSAPNNYGAQYTIFQLRIIIESRFGTPRLQPRAEFIHA